ncbi:MULTISPECIES: glutathione S-transferase domain-containing protein [Hyphomicrobiales]|uniref:glutathione S-transferase family protein n=1 Tax=Methylobacterium sp. CCH7-A2 TaxID=1768789 RepID=UPI0012E32FE3|nr:MULTISPECIES: glutathione S-transferase domain-containing protein [Hyphomicrobiales]
MARHHVEVEVGSSILADIGTVVTTKDEAAFDAKVVALKGKLARVETALGDGRYFIGPPFSLVDGAFDPAFR